MQKANANQKNAGSKIALQIKDLSKIYPGTVALHRVNIDIQEGEVHGIIGKNGAGKSTLVGIIAGIINQTEGEVIIGGKRYEHLSRINARKEKIAIVPQEPKMILECSVAENLFYPDYSSSSKMGVINWKKLYGKASEIVTKAGLDINVHSRGGDLSLSEQQIILILKACYVENAQIIIFDEASASLSGKDVQLLYNIIRERKEAGCTIIFISHIIDELMSICDRVTTLRDGESVSTEPGANLDKEKLSTLIVGETDLLKNDQSEYLRGPKSFGEKVFTANNLTRAGEFYRINFSVKRGEILGLAGLRGSGRTELLKSIIGVYPVEEGTIRIRGSLKRIKSPARSFNEGLVYMPEDREKEGLINTATVRENIVISALKRISRGIFIQRRAENNLVKQLVEMLDIKISTPEQEINQLSGGNKQKVVVGRTLATAPDVYLLDEPTKGVDISAKESINNIIKNELCKNAAIVITSPGLDDLLLVCDRILVIYHGEITREYKREEFDEAEIYMAMQGGPGEANSA